MIRVLAVLSGLLVCLFAGAAGHAQPAPVAVDCKVPQELLEDDPRMTGLAERLRAKKPITIVAIGGASTAGTAAGSDENNSYPHRLEEALRQRHPDIAITVLNKGVPRQTTEEMIDRFDRDVVPHAPALVIWETGTVDAVRGTDVDDFALALAKGIAALRQHNFDILLVSMQYNPSTASVINFEPYLETMRRAADLEDVYLFRRFEIMRYWSDAGIFDFVDVPKDRRTWLAGEVYRCLGDSVAEAIGFAAQ
jgi:lysophospholipase L1-like esterase